MDWDNLKRLLKEGESERLEFKENSFLKDVQEIASQLVSFANRNGGKIAVGVRDDGSIEGAKIDHDKASLHVLNIASNNCSPVVEVSFERLSSDEGDVLAINVVKRKDSPHAVIRKAGAEIKERVYYIRSGNGKRLADDTVLRFMFKSVGDPHLDSNFRICVWYGRNTLNFFPFGLPPYTIYLIPFMQALRKEDVQFLLEKETERVQSFLTEILPYAFLSHISWTFPSSWLVKIERRYGVMTLSPMKVDLPGKVFAHSDIPLRKGTVTSQMGVDLTSILKKFLLNFRLPENTTIDIDLNGQTAHVSSLSLKNPFFEFQIQFSASIWSVGLPSQIIAEPLLDPLQSQKDFAYTTILTKFNGKFGFPDAADPDFENHFEFGKIILGLLQNDWDWDREIRKINESRIHSMDRNLRRVLEILEKK